jgi:hypothetical protein
MISKRIQLPAYLLLSTLGLAVTPAPAKADPSDDYVACLVGRAAVALHKQSKKDSGKALEIAHRQCREPKGLSENELEGLSDYVSTLVDAMAST